MAEQRSSKRKRKDEDSEDNEGAAPATRAYRDTTVGDGASAHLGDNNTSITRGVNVSGGFHFHFHFSHTQDHASTADSVSVSHNHAVAQFGSILNHLQSTGLLAMQHNVQAVPWEQNFTHIQNFSPLAVQPPPNIQTARDFSFSLLPQPAYSSTSGVAQARPLPPYYPQRLPIPPVGPVFSSHSTGVHAAFPSRVPPLSQSHRNQNASPYHSVPSYGNMGPPPKPSGLDTSLKCGKCGKPFDRKSRLRKHEKRHLRIYGCTFDHCYKTFKSVKEWTHHELSQHVPAEGWRCPFPESGKLCGFYSDNLQVITCHLIYKHDSDENNLHSRLELCSLEGAYTRFWCGFCQQILVPDGLKASGIYSHVLSHIDNSAKYPPLMDSWIELRGGGKTKAEMRAFAKKQSETKNVRVWDDSSASEVSDGVDNS